MWHTCLSHWFLFICFGHIPECDVPPCLSCGKESFALCKLLDGDIGGSCLIYNGSSCHAHTLLVVDELVRKVAKTFEAACCLVVS